ncbi:hypothetical protein GOV06_01325 [Candidatus Woesearchaeota archaeon]|nr:hypothetical protein [Candidatus Woesearchaeota archaeon]
MLENQSQKTSFEQGIESIVEQAKAYREQISGNDKVIDSLLEIERRELLESGSIFDPYQKNLKKDIETSYRLADTYARLREFREAENILTRISNVSRILMKTDQITQAGYMQELEKVTDRISEYTHMAGVSAANMPEADDLKYFSDEFFGQGSLISN